jgi:hypothetical protein
MAKRFGLSVFAVFGLLILALPNDSQSQTILHVNRTDGTCGGQSPCFTTIQAAIN